MSVSSGEVEALCRYSIETSKCHDLPQRLLQKCEISMHVRNSQPSAVHLPEFGAHSKEDLRVRTTNWVERYGLVDQLAPTGARWIPESSS